MRKLVLGIIALLSVQFAFVTYMMVLQAPRIVELSPAPAQVQPTAERADVTPHAERDEPSPEVATPPAASQAAMTALVRNGSDRVLKSPVLIRSDSRRPAFSRTLKPVRSRDDFKTVVIRYNRNPDSTDCEPLHLPRTKKRPYLAKALPVIKRPWEWMKAVGSKLN
jgi:hypothetical protein